MNKSGRWAIGDGRWFKPLTFNLAPWGLSVSWPCTSVIFLVMPVVKVRFAPSPTGNLHVGNLRTAVLNYLYARNQGGTFTLRIEDTDMERSEIQYEASIMDDLKWLGINWDDGPYRQSERTDLYRDFAKTLLEKGSAYKCFCPKEKLEDARRASLDKGEPPRYDGRCRDLSEEDLKNLKEKAGLT